MSWAIALSSRMPGPHSGGVYAAPNWTLPGSARRFADQCYSYLHCHRVQAANEGRSGPKIAPGATPRCWKGLAIPTPQKHDRHPLWPKAASSRRPGPAPNYAATATATAATATSTGTATSATLTGTFAMIISDALLAASCKDLVER